MMETGKPITTITITPEKEPIPGKSTPAETPATTPEPVPAGV